MALQQEIIQALHVKPHIDTAQEVRVSVDFLKNYLLAHPFIKSLVLGISGGQDSTLTGKLCQRQLVNCVHKPQTTVISSSRCVCPMACRQMSQTALTPSTLSNPIKFLP